MIDITTFLNSKDIAEHWKKIGFLCTPVQAAYIIWQSHEKSLQEKHEAWKELMETTPDCPFAEGRRKEHLKHNIPEALTDSLHAFLKAYMALEDKTLERFTARKRIPPTGIVPSPNRGMRRSGTMISGSIARRRTAWMM